MNSFGLQELIGPLEVDKFLSSHWLTSNAFLSEPNRSLLDLFSQLPEFKSPESLIAAAQEDVILFCADGFRATTPSDQAVDCYHRGDTLYLICLERSLPKLEGVRTRLAKELGIGTEHVYVEAFLARAGSIATMHYDWDVNFQILLSGKKTWRLLRNSNVINPDSSFYPGSHWSSEAFAANRSIPANMENDTITLEAEAGSVLFLPRGMWHETRSETDCMAVNFVLRPPMWHDLLTRTVRNRLHGFDEFRQFAFGIDGGSFQETAASQFEQVKQQFIQELQTLRFDQLNVQTQTQAFRWLPGLRPLVERATDELVLSNGTSSATSTCKIPIQYESCLTELCKLRHRFGIREAQWFGPDLSIKQLVWLFDELVRSEFIEQW